MSYKDWMEQEKNRINNKVSNTNNNKNIQDPNKDWTIDETTEKINPIYTGDFKNYYLSMKDIIGGLNTSKYPISGENVWLPDEDGNLIPLPEWVNNKPGKDPIYNYRLEMLSTQGNIIKDKNFSTTLKAILYEDNKDVTADKQAKYFKWARFSGATESDQIADAEWNLRWASGAKEIPITHDDVNRNAMFQVQFVTEKEDVLWVIEAYKNYNNLLNNK